MIIYVYTILEHAKNKICVICRFKKVQMFLLLAGRALAYSGLGEPSHDERLHFLELCAGSHRMTDCMLEYGLFAHAMDATQC